MSRPCPEDFGGERRPDGSIHWSDPDRADDFADAMACEDESEASAFIAPGLVLEAVGNRPLSEQEARLACEGNYPGDFRVDPRKEKL